MSNISHYSIDILLATFNGEKVIRDQLDSLFAQTVKNWHLLVHDDGSTDATVDIVKEYQSANPEKISLIEDGFITGGAKNNFAHLMAKSNALYVMFCDQDDVWLPEKVELTLARMIETEKKYPGLAVLVHTDMEVVDSNLKSIAGSAHKYHKASAQPDMDELMVCNSVSGCTMMVNRLGLESAMPVPAVAVMHDWWIALRVLSIKGRIEFIDKSTMLYRQHEGNAMGAVKVDWSRYIYRLMNPRMLFKDLRLAFIQAKSVKSLSLACFLKKKIKHILKKTLSHQKKNV